MNNIRIQNLPLMSPVDSMRIPTGGSGSYSIDLSSLRDFIRLDLFKPVLPVYENLPDVKEVKGRIIVSDNGLKFSDGENYYNIVVEEINPPIGNVWDAVIHELNNNEVFDTVYINGIVSPRTEDIGYSFHDQPVSNITLSLAFNGVNETPITPDNVPVTITYEPYAINQGWLYKNNRESPPPFPLNGNINLPDNLMLILSDDAKNLIFGYASTLVNNGAGDTPLIEFFSYVVNDGFDQPIFDYNVLASEINDDHSILDTLTVNSNPFAIDTNNSSYKGTAKTHYRFLDTNGVVKAEYTCLVELTFYYDGDDPIPTSTPTISINNFLSGFNGSIVVGSNWSDSYIDNFDDYFIRAGTSTISQIGGHASTWQTVTDGIISSTISSGIREVTGSNGDLTLTKNEDFGRTDLIIEASQSGYESWYLVVLASENDLTGYNLPEIPNAETDAFSLLNIDRTFYMKLFFIRFRYN